MELSEHLRRAAKARWAKVKSKRERSEIMKRVRRGKKFSKPRSDRGLGGGKRRKDAGL